MFTLKQLRKAVEGNKLLDPLNLLYFNEMLLELDFIEEGNLSKTVKTFFDLAIGYALIFK